jgi:hypothetical protein
VEAPVPVDSAARDAWARQERLHYAPDSAVGNA